MFKGKLELENVNKEFKDMYNDLYSRCAEEKKELLNLIILEGSCGVPFTDKLLQHFPELIDEKIDGGDIMKCAIVGCKKEGKNWLIDKKTSTDFCVCEEHTPKKKG